MVGWIKLYPLSLSLTSLLSQPQSYLYPHPPLFTPYTYRAHRDSSFSLGMRGRRGVDLASLPAFTECDRLLVLRVRNVITESEVLLPKSSKRSTQEVPAP